MKRNTIGNQLEALEKVARGLAVLWLCGLFLGAVLIGCSSRNTGSNDADEVDSGDTNTGDTNTGDTNTDEPSTDEPSTGDPNTDAPDTGDQTECIPLSEVPSPISRIGSVEQVCEMPTTCEDALPSGGLLLAGYCATQETLFSDAQAICAAFTVSTTSSNLQGTVDEDGSQITATGSATFRASITFPNACTGCRCGDISLPGATCDPVCYSGECFCSSTRVSSVGGPLRLVDGTFVTESGEAVPHCMGEGGTLTLRAPDGSWTARYEPIEALATPEICDGKDNDLDSVVDNAPVECASCNEVGVCGEAYEATCVDGQWHCTYTAPAYEAEETLCDNLDNDCDGEVDESTLCAPPPVTLKGDARGKEGDVVSFRVTIPEARGLAFEVDWQTSDGTALAGQDYEASSGTARFDAGVTETTLDVPALPDADFEFDEDFKVTLTACRGCEIEVATAKGYVIDNGSGTSHEFYALDRSVPCSPCSLVEPAGDFNGDGSPDVVTAGHTDGSDTVRVISLVDGEVLWEQTIAQGDPLLRHRVAGAGDVDGDGFDDVVIGFQDHESNRGRVQIIGGDEAAGGRTELFTMQGFGEGDQLGAGVAGVGDVNGDGFDDVAAGATKVSGLKDGRVYIIRGAAAPKDIALFREIREDSLPYLGQFLRGVGDVNADGYADFVMGSPYSVGGSLIVMAGAPTPAGIATHFRLDGESSAKVGIPFDGLGDINSDGLDDIIYGSETAKVEGVNEAGLIRLLLGGDDGMTADAEVTASLKRDFFGRPVYSLGDVTGDDKADVLAGAQYYKGVGGRQGRLYIVRTRPSANIVGSITPDGDTCFGLEAAVVRDMNGDSRKDVVLAAGSRLCVWLSK